jgi:flagellar basal body-associated protein FliL
MFIVIVGLLIGAVIVYYMFFSQEKTESTQTSGERQAIQKLYYG